MTLLFIVLVAASILGVLALTALRFWRIRGTRLVTCPENRQTVAVEVAATRAALTSLTGRPALRLSDCSRWPEKEGCGRECLSQIEAAPDGCLVRRILENWYAGKNCVICGRELLRVEWLERQPALLGPDGVTLEWGQLVPERIPEALRTHMPVCFDCHVASTFRRRFRHLVVDRPWDSSELGGKL